MSPSLKKISRFSLAAVVLLVQGGCIGGGDGKNASDNPSTAPQLIPASGSGGGATVTPLPEAGAPLTINSSSLGDVTTAKSVIDGSGNITTVWTQSNGAHIDLWSSRYTVGSSWSNPQKLESGTLDVKSFQLVVDAGGNVTVVYAQATADFYMVGPTRVDVERTDLWATSYSNGGWAAEALIEHSDLSAAATNSVDDISELQLAVDSTGTVTALWTQHNGSHYDLYASRNVATVWDTTPTLVDSEHLGDVTSPQLLVDAAGNLFALWLQSNGTLLNLWGAHYAAAAWSTATKIDSEDLGDVEAPKAVVDSSGNATIAWRQFDGSRWNLWTSRYAGGAWAVATLAETQAGDVITPQLLLYGTTNVLLLWGQTDGTVNNVWSKHYNGSSWVDDGVITDGAGNSGSITMVKDSADVITAAWVQHDGVSLSPQDNLWANRFSGAWGSPTLVETSNTGDVRSPMLMVDSSKRVTAVWLQKESGRFDLWSNRNVSGNWGAAGLVEGLNDGSAVDPHAVMSNSGNITLVWRQPYGSSDYLVTNNYTVGPASGWGTVANIESQNYDGGYNPQLLIDGNGIVTVVWLQPIVLGKSVRIDLWANRF